jgi:protoporphyrinogen oxidase
LGAYPDIDGWLASLDLRRTLTLALSVDASVGRDVFGIFTDPSAGRIVSACAVHGAKAGDDAIGTHDVILAWPTPEEATRLVAEPAERVVSAMLPEIERLLPAMRGKVRRARVYRVEEGTPLAAPGFAAQRKRGRQLLDELQAPVTLAGDYLTMPLVEGAVLSGEDAADRLLARIK